MPTLHIAPSTLAGRIALPPSKSDTLRALLFASVAGGTSTIDHYLPSPDTRAMVSALTQLGAAIEIRPEQIAVQGTAGALRPAKDVIDAGNSGQVLRFVGALAGLLPTYTAFTGDASIRNSRPVQPLLSAMEQLGATVESTSGRPPFALRGPLQPGVATLSGEDSQPVSALLIATSLLPGATTLHVTHPGEQPWIELTLSWLRRFGANVAHENYQRYHIPGSLQVEPFQTTIAGDWSSAAYPMIASLVTRSPLTLEGLNPLDVQGDRIVLQWLREMGLSCEIDEERQQITLFPPASFSGRVFDGNLCIDALPILAVLGCYADTPIEIVNSAIARRKESDRIHAIATELRKMGAQIEERPDGLSITPSPLRGAHLFAHHDHRIAMALAVAALRAHGTTTIEGAECIDKSYPSFVTDFQRLGARMRLI